MSLNYLKISLLEEQNIYNLEDNIKANRILPFGNSPLLFLPIDSCSRITHGEDVKTVYQLTFNLQDVDYEFEPGDTIGVLPANKATIVDELLHRLGVKTGNQPCQIEILPNTTKKKPEIPKHLPGGVTTLKNIFLYNVEIRTPPKKLFLKALIRFTQSEAEIERLAAICAPTGSELYNELINQAGRTLIGLLHEFPTCQPPIAVLLEHLPPLQPRAYSISNFRKHSKHKLDITFFIFENYEGLCTSWMESLGQLEKKPVLPIYFRKPSFFRLPTDKTVPLILIATGTGIAPFRGFLQSILYDNHAKKSKVILFYGCRYRRDFLYETEIENYLKEGVLNRLEVAYSRETDKKVYITEKIEQLREELNGLILNETATIFVCGDLKTTVQSVEKVLIISLGQSVSDPETYLKDLKTSNRFIVDSWT